MALGWGIISAGLSEGWRDGVDTTEEPGLGPRSNYVADVEDFRQALRQDREPLASGTDGLPVVEVTQAMAESAGTGVR